MKKKSTYQSPAADLILFATEDVLDASSPGGSSGGKDENQGEWDPQIVNVFK